MKGRGRDSKVFQRLPPTRDGGLSRMSVRGGLFVSWLQVHCWATSALWSKAPTLPPPPSLSVCYPRLRAWRRKETHNLQSTFHFVKSRCPKTTTSPWNDNFLSDTNMPLSGSHHFSDIIYFYLLIYLFFTKYQINKQRPTSMKLEFFCWSAFIGHL